MILILSIKLIHLLHTFVYLLNFPLLLLKLLAKHPKESTLPIAHLLSLEPVQSTPGRELGGDGPVHVPAAHARQPAFGGLLLFALDDWQVAGSFTLKY